MKINFKRCLITGAGSGIGLSLCRLIQSNGTMVYAVDRYLDSDTHFNHPFIVADICSAGFIDDLTRNITQPFDLIIHCAAISAVGRFEQLSIDCLDSVLQTNLLAPITVTRDLINKQLVTAEATHVFVASMSCYTGYPGATAYAASKDGIAVFARCLRDSLRKKGGNVVTAFPGPTNTPHATLYSPDNSKDYKRMTPDSVALAIWKACCHENAVAFTRKRDRIGALLASFFPEFATRLMAAWLLPQLDQNNATYIDQFYLNSRNKIDQKHTYQSQH